MKIKKINAILILLLSAVLILSGCKTAESPAAENSERTLKEAVITTPFSETTTTTSPAATTPEITAQETTVTTLPEVVSITTTPPPVTSESSLTALEITHMTAPEITTPFITSVPLVTTAVQIQTASPIQQKLTPISSTYTYNNLSPDKKIVYNKILSAAKSRTSMINFDNPQTIETITDMYSLIYSEEINLQFLAQSFKYDTNPVSKLQISFTYPTDVINSIDAQTEVRANEIIACITPTMTAYDIVKYFHDTIIMNCTYDADAEFSSTAYGALVKGRALCQGYSHAMALLCNKIGIENAYITGYAGEAHMWNMVKLDGDWYNIDVTWDDPDKPDKPDLIFYDYFNVTDADLSARQIYPGYIQLPSSAASADNYFVRSGLIAGSVDEAQQILYNQYINTVNANGRYVRIKCADAEVYSQVCQALITDQGIFNIQAEANKQTVNKFNDAALNLIQNNEMHAVSFIIIY